MASPSPWGNGAPVALARTWKLVVTELGSGAPLHEVFVEATNWMGALDAGTRAPRRAGRSARRRELRGGARRAGDTPRSDGAPHLRSDAATPVEPSSGGGEPIAAVGGNSSGAGRHGSALVLNHANATDSYRPAPPAASSASAAQPAEPNAAESFNGEEQEEGSPAYDRVRRVADSESTAYTERHPPFKKYDRIPGETVAGGVSGTGRGNRDGRGCCGRPRCDGVPSSDRATLEPKTFVGPPPST